MDDLILRQKAIKLAIDLDYESRGVLKESKCREIENRYNMIPAAQPERKQAKWIVGGIEEDSGYLGSRWYECERCHTPGDLSDKFCRGCGAEMQT